MHIRCFSFVRQICTVNNNKVPGDITMHTMGKNVTDEELKQYFPDFPDGPLQEYRNKATFNWRRIKLVYDSLSSIKTKVSIKELFFYTFFKIITQIMEVQK